jgi:Pentapeptide repeats (8 copies)
MPKPPWRFPARIYRPVLITFAVAVILWLVLLAPRLLVPAPSNASLRDVTDPVKRQQLVDERLTLQNNVRTTLLQGIGGAVLLLGAYLTFRQFQLNQEGHITDRFTHAIDQLGDDKLAVRVGGIAALGRIARDSAKDHEPVMESLAAFLREQSSELGRSQEESPSADTPHLRGDLQAAATILGYRPVSRRRDESRRINLRNTYLGRAHLRKAHYERMALTNADFRSAQLTGIYLNYALLRGARFERAVLEEANFTGAFLVGADLRFARLGRANFDEAWLFGANLEGAHVRHADLTGGYSETEPFLNWLQKTLGPSPWSWAILREGLDTPGDTVLSFLREELSRSKAQVADEEQVREGLRQLRVFLEKELAVSDRDEVHDVRVAQVLQTRGLAPDIEPPVERAAERDDGIG